MQRGRGQHHLLRDPRSNTVATWAQQTDPGFRFVVKLPKLVTHERRFAGVETQMRAYLDAIEPIGERAVLWTRLPASFGASDIDALGRFLRRLPADAPSRCATPASSLTSLLERTLADTDAEWMPFDTTVFFQSPPTTEAKQHAWTKNPRLPQRTRALTHWSIVRYLGRDPVKDSVQGYRLWTGMELIGPTYAEEAYGTAVDPLPTLVWRGLRM